MNLLGLEPSHYPIVLIIIGAIMFIALLVHIYDMAKHWDEAFEQLRKREAEEQEAKRRGLVLPWPHSETFRP